MWVGRHMQIHYVAYGGLDFFNPSFTVEYWDYRQVLSYTGYAALGIKLSAL